MCFPDGWSKNLNVFDVVDGSIWLVGVIDDDDVDDDGGGVVDDDGGVGDEEDENDNIDDEGIIIEFFNALVIFWHFNVLLFLLYIRTVDLHLLKSIFIIISI